MSLEGCLVLYNLGYSADRRGPRLTADLGSRPQDHRVQPCVTIEIKLSTFLEGTWLWKSNENGALKMVIHACFSY